MAAWSYVKVDRTLAVWDQRAALERALETRLRPYDVQSVIGAYKHRDGFSFEADQDTLIVRLKKDARVTPQEALVRAQEALAERREKRPWRIVVRAHGTRTEGRYTPAGRSP